MTFDSRLKITGIGGTTTYVTARAKVKITLGMSVAYYTEIWCGNIGEGIDCLLGMDFMISAGVRLSMYEGMVRLPDEESIPLASPGGRPKLPVKIPIMSSMDLYVGSGKTVDVPIIYGKSNPDLVLWVRRSPQWVTTVVYDDRGQPATIRVTNVTKKPICVTQRTPVGHLVGHGHLPDGDICVRPGSVKYQEWQVLAYESSHSDQFLDRERTADIARERTLPPPVVRVPYSVPARILARGEPDTPPSLDQATQLEDLERGEAQSTPAHAVVNLVTDERVDSLTSVSVPHAKSSQRTRTESKVALTVNSSLESSDEAPKTNTDSVAGLEMVSSTPMPASAHVIVPDTTVRALQPHVSGDRGQGKPTEREVAGSDPGITMKVVFGGMEHPTRDAKVFTVRQCPTSAVEQLSRSFVAAAVEAVDQVNEDDSASVYYHEGSDFMSLDELRDQLALPEFEEPSGPCDMSLADVGEPDENTSSEMDQLRDILRKHHSAFMNSGNAAPPPARGVVCDIEIDPGVKPIAERPRPIQSQYLVKVFKLLKALLNANIIEYSDSDWASPIVVIVKKNGLDIRLCIDYRRVNKLIKLLRYPLPLIDELLDNFESVMWFLSLDMASGFWAILMTQRAKHISAFICPLGHFQWLRMPFGLKNAPLVYQMVIDNVLWGWVRLPPLLETEVGDEVLEGVGIGVSGAQNTSDDFSIDEQAATKSSSCLDPVAGSALGQHQSSGTIVFEAEAEDGTTVFQRNLPAPEYMGPVLGRSSYIDDIAAGTKTWDELCQLVDRLLYRVRYWGLSISLPKSSFGKRSVEFLSHEVSRAGIRALPKIVKGIDQLEFPSTLKGVQSFLGSLNYYHKFIEDFPVLATVLYELTDEQVRAGKDLDKAKRAFELLKERIQSTPVLRHPAKERPYAIILHANPWAISAVLAQEHDGKLWPVRFAGRTLHDAELRYHDSEKEVLALMRVLTSFYTLVAGHELKIYSRFSLLKWMMTSRTLSERLLKWATFLSPWTFEVHKTERDQDGLASLFATGITPRERLDEIAAELVPAKANRSAPPIISLEMLETEYDGYVLSFDGAAKLKINTGSAGFIVWKLPAWEPIYAKGVALSGVTVNEAEYQGLLQGVEHFITQHPGEDLVVAGDSRIVIQQCQGLIGCNQPHLRLLLQEFETLRQKLGSVRLVHVKRDYNSAADYLTGKVLRVGADCVIDDKSELSQIASLNRLPQKLTQGVEAKEGQADVASNAVAYAVRTRRQTRSRENIADSTLQRAHTPSVELPASARSQVDSSDATQDEATSSSEQCAGSSTVAEVVNERWRRIIVHQEADPDLFVIKQFLAGQLADLSPQHAREAAKVADQFVVDGEGVLRYVGGAPRSRLREDAPRLVVPRDMRSDVLHMCHDDVQAGHQGIVRTYDRVRADYYWRGMYRDVEMHVRECIDCVTAKGVATNAGPSPGNVLPERPMQIISMDFVLPLPASRQGSTALLLFQDMFSGFVMCKAMSSTTAQDVAEAYEEVVFRRYGASSELRHDRDPRFMSDVFGHFAQMMGSQQRATLAYRPQANGQQERSVQTLVRTIRAYVEEPAQEDWEDLAGRLTFALNTSVDATRRETPFFLMHGWDAMTTMSAMLLRPARGVSALTSYAWRISVQRQYEHAQAEARRFQEDAKRARAEERNRAWEQLADRYKAGFEVGDAVWLYVARVKPGLTKKLAHMWHGPFRIVEKSQDFMCKLKVSGTPYRMFPWVHVSRLKPRLLYERRPDEHLPEVPEDADFDAALLPEDSWEADHQAGEYDVEALLDVRWGRTRSGRRSKEYLVKWTGYDEPTWEPLIQLRCGRLLHEFDRSIRGRARFAAMQVDDGGNDSN